MVFPFAKQAIRAMTGSSSIRVGIMLPSTTVPWSSLVFTRRSATGSPPSSRVFNKVMSAPMSWHTFKIPARVSLMPTFLIVISESGVIKPATMKNAAEEMSPGTSICCPCNVSGGVMVQVFPSDTISAPKERSILSVWSLERAGSVTLVFPSAYNPARRTQDFTWADATGEL